MAEVTDNEDGGNVTVATLIRGKVYTFNDYDPEVGGPGTYHTFERAVPTPVSEELADKLEELVEEIPDGDGDLITKDIFKIDRNAPARAVQPIRKKVRFRMVSEEVDERPVLRAPPRKPLTAGNKPGTFKKRVTG